MTGAVALVVIGPERLPKVARTVGAMVARAQRFVNNVKADIQREVELDSLRKLEAEMNEAGRKLGAELSGELASAQQTLHTLGEETHAALSESPAAPATPDHVANPTVTVGAPAAEAVATLDRTEQQFDLFSPPPAPPMPDRPPRDRR